MQLNPAKSRWDRPARLPRRVVQLPLSCVFAVAGAPTSSPAERLAILATPTDTAVMATAKPRNRPIMGALVADSGWRLVKPVLPTRHRALNRRRLELRSCHAKSKHTSTLRTQHACLNFARQDRERGQNNRARVSTRED